MFFWCIKESGGNNKDEQTTHYTRYICVRLHSINMKSEKQILKEMEESDRERGAIMETKDGKMTRITKK